MIISDLNYIETVSEADNLVIGGKKSSSKKPLKKIKLNKATINQIAINIVIGGGKGSYTVGSISQSAVVNQS